MNSFLPIIIVSLYLTKSSKCGHYHNPTRAQHYYAGLRVWSTWPVLLTNLGHFPNCLPSHATAHATAPYAHVSTPLHLHCVLRCMCPCLSPSVTCCAASARDHDWFPPMWVVCLLTWYYVIGKCYYSRRTRTSSAHFAPHDTCTCAVHVLRSNKSPHK